MHHMEQHLVSASPVIHSVPQLAKNQKTLTETSPKINETLTDFVGVFITHIFLVSFQKGVGHYQIPDHNYVQTCLTASNYKSSRFYPHVPYVDIYDYGIIRWKKKGTYVHMYGAIYIYIKISLWFVITCYRIYIYIHMLLKGIGIMVIQKSWAITWIGRYRFFEGWPSPFMEKQLFWPRHIDYQTIGLYTPCFMYNCKYKYI